MCYLNRKILYFNQPIDLYKSHSLFLSSNLYIADNDMVSNKTKLKLLFPIIANLEIKKKYF
jgi:hypothetical protein